MPVTRRKLTVGPYEVTVSEREDAPLIILTRMAAAGMGIWDTIWDQFAAYFSVANFDLVQVPEARSMDDPGTTFRALGRATVDVAAGLGHDRFHVFGWNGGTLVAIACASAFPERIASCILLDPFFELDDMRHVEKAVVFKRVLYENDRELYVYYWLMAGLSSRFIESNFDTIERLAKRRIAGDRFVGSDVERFMRWVMALRTNWFSDADYARIACPTMIVATELDRWNAGPSLAMARAVRERITGAELTVIDGVGGHFLIEDPDRFIAAVEPFLHKVTGGPWSG